MKKIFSIFIVFMLLFSCTAKCFAVENTVKTPIEAKNKYVNYNQDHLGIDKKEEGLLSYGSKYIPEDYTLPNVKLQDQQTCWLYSSMACAEILYSKKYGNKNSFSEQHALTVLTDALKVKNHYSSEDNISGFYKIKKSDGGNFEMAMQYMTNWNNPISSNNSLEWNSMIDERFQGDADSDFNTTAESRINVTDARYIPNSTDCIKRSIINYGSVYSAMHFDSTVYYINDGKCYYNSKLERDYIIDHAITIVGWDDNYSKNNFSNALFYEKPSIDGAWLVRNSNEIEQNGGYFWLSYAEMSLNSHGFKPSIIEKIANSNSNQKMLSYDYLYLGSSYVAENDASIANIYDTSVLDNDYDKLKYVMTYLRTDGCLYKVYIVQADNINQLPTNLDDYDPVAEGSYAGEGYLTIKLDNDGYNITPGNKYAVIIQTAPIENDNITSFCYETSSIFGDCEFNANESFVFDDSYKNYWVDSYDLNKGNFCIRPVFEKSADDSNVSVTPDRIINTSIDTQIDITSNRNLFKIVTDKNFLLREDRDYYDTDSGIVLTRSFLESLNGNYTEINFVFNNNIVRTIIVNPKSSITNVVVDGIPAVGETLIASCTGFPIKSNYEVNYQWQSSFDGINWYDIANAQKSSYQINNNDFNRFLRVKVTSEKFANVVYPTEKYSDRLPEKVVISGDVDLDGEITTLDATIISKYLASLISLNSRQLLAADVNCDGTIDTIDVVCIQKIVANL